MSHNTTVTPEDHVQGSPEASITLIEYGDYECPHCGQAYWIIKDLQQRFGDDLRFVYRNFPLSEIHPLAEPAAEATEFAGSHDRFWEMHDAIYENQQSLSIEMLRQLGEGLSFDGGEVQQAIEQRTFLPRIQREFITGVRAGVNGTPTFYLNGTRFNGRAEDLAFAIENLRGERAA